MRRSVALCLFLPEGPAEREFGEEASRRWDSLRRRWRARSFLRLRASAAASPSSSAADLELSEGFLVGLVGGFADFLRLSFSQTLPTDHF